MSQVYRRQTVVIRYKRSTQTLEGRNLPDRPSLLIPYRCGKRNIEIFAPCMRVEPSDLEPERRVGGRMVTMCHNPTRWAQWAQHPLPPTTLLSLTLGVSNSDVLEPVGGGASPRCCGLFSQSGGDAPYALLFLQLR